MRASLTLVLLAFAALVRAAVPRRYMHALALARAEFGWAVRWI